MLYAFVVASSLSLLEWSRRALACDPLGQFLAAACGNRSGGRLWIELDAASTGEVEEPLALGVIFSPAEEKPGKEAEGDETALGHHHDAGGALVGER